MDPFQIIGESVRQPCRHAPAPPAAEKPPADAARSSESKLKREFLACAAGE
jgi:hypothetical protein